MSRRSDYRSSEYKPMRMAVKPQAAKRQARFTFGSKPVVLLDRDGTLNEEIGYIRNLDDLKLIRGAAQSVKRLNDADITAIVVTNQTGAARGFYNEEHIKSLNQRLILMLAEHGAYLDDFYYCPHLEQAPVKEYSGACKCRKPEIGMIEQAFKDHPELDRAHAYVIGDKATDVELAKNFKAKGILVTTGYGGSVAKNEFQNTAKPDYVCASIVEAVDWILINIAKDS